MSSSMSVSGDGGGSSVAGRFKGAAAVMSGGAAVGTFAAINAFVRWGDSR
jgi:hypothetical protein